MDNSFSLYRVALLIKRQWASFGKIFLIALGAVALILLGFYLYNLPNKDNISSFRMGKEGIIYLEFPAVLYSVVGLLFVSLSSSWYFGKWGKKANVMEELLLPASNLEKAVCGIFLTLVCMATFLVVFLVIDQSYRMYLNDFVKTLDKSVVSHAYYSEDNIVNVTISRCHANTFINEIGGFFGFTILIGLLIQSIFLLGSIYFKRFPYIKTTVSLLLTIFVVVFSTIKFGNFMINGKERVYHTLGDLDRSRDMPYPYWFVLAFSLLIVLFYWITFLRVKEKEV